MKAMNNSSDNASDMVDKLLDYNTNIMTGKLKKIKNLILEEMCPA